MTSAAESIFVYLATGVIGVCAITWVVRLFVSVVYSFEDGPYDAD